MTTRSCSAGGRFTGRMWLLLIAALVLAPTDLQAQLRVCNRTADTDSVRVALGYPIDDEWVSKGWFTALPDRCVTLIENSLSNRYYYLHARAYPGGEEWVGDHAFCVSSRAFQIFGTHGCGDRGYRETGFYQVDVGTTRAYVEVLVDPEERDAAVAGIVHTERESMMLSGTTVLVMRNPASFGVSFRLVCYTLGGASKEFPITIEAQGVVEIGYVQGWDGNFVTGERCRAYSGNTLAWAHEF